MKHLPIISLGFALALFAPAVDAVPLWVGWGIQDGVVGIKVGGQYIGYDAPTGAMEGRQGGVDGTSLGYMYCVDLLNAMDLNHTYDYDAFDTTHPDLNQPPGAGYVRRNGSWAAWLYRNHGRRVTTASEAGAMQVALWEILYDGNADLRSGNFRLLGAFSHESQANYYLGLAPVPGEIEAYYKHTAGHQQDLIGPMSTVPEPATLLLLGAGLAAAGAAARKRSRA